MSDELQLDDLLKANQSSQPVKNETAKKLQKKLTSIDRADLEKEIETKAQASGYSYINLEKFPISIEALALIPENQANSLSMICFFYNGHAIKIGSTNPTDPQAMILVKKLADSYHAQTEVFLISADSLKKALALYAKVPKLKAPSGTVSLTKEDLDKYKDLTSFDKLQNALANANMTEMVAMVVSAGIQTNASDIHIEAEETNIIIRFRLDGILNIVAKIPKEKWTKIISRLKLLAGLKLNIANKPQDGRISIKLAGGQTLDIRVSTIPTSFGESVVMRLLKPSTIGLKFEDLGLTGKAYERLKEQIKKPNGMIITTGPTGSGKTTTLYAILKKLNSPKTKIITLEDPVEYKLAGISQSQIDHSKDYTFVSGLRSILRQDPDIIMVGEIRDLETADVAINAALTGHLVISTIHTNSGAGAIPRLLSLGLAPHLLSPALNAIIGQRLVRKLCESCKKPAELDKQILTKVKKILSGIPENSGQKLTENELANLQFHQATACNKCKQQGYQGRIGIYEIITMAPEIEAQILSGKVSEYQIQELATKNGSLTMVQDGLLKATKGITSVEEVFRVAE